MADKSFIEMRLDPDNVKEELKQVVPGLRALQYYHDNPDSSFANTLDLLAEDVVPFYAAHKYSAEPEDYVKEAVLLSSPVKGRSYINNNPRARYYNHGGDLVTIKKRGDKVEMFNVDDNAIEDVMDRPDYNYLINTNSLIKYPSSKVALQDLNESEAAGYHNARRLKDNLLNDYRNNVLPLDLAERNYNSIVNNPQYKEVFDNLNKWDPNWATRNDMYWLDRNNDIYVYDRFNSVLKYNPITNQFYNMELNLQTPPDLHRVAQPISPIGNKIKAQREKEYNNNVDVNPSNNLMEEVYYNDDYYRNLMDAYAEYLKQIDAANPNIAIPRIEGYQE